MQHEAPSDPAPNALPATPTARNLDDPLGLPDVFDPNDYDWHPVARRKRADGWTHARAQRRYPNIARKRTPTARQLPAKPPQK